MQFIQPLVLASWLFIGLTIIWFLLFLVVSYYRFLEERLHVGLEKEMENIKKQPVAMPFIEGQLDNLNKKYKLEFDRLSRQKQFIQDILPFIKK